MDVTCAPVQKTVLFILLCSVLTTVYGTNILYITAHGSRSHHLWHRKLALGLVAKGHNVTLIGPIEDKPSPNYTVIHLEGLFEVLESDHDLNNMPTNTWEMMMEVNVYCMTICEHLVKTKGLQTLLDYPPDFKFDLVLVEVAFVTCFNPLIQRFGYPPTIGISPFLLPSYNSYNFGNHLHPSYVPWFAFDSYMNMSFPERVMNHIYTNLDVFIRNNFEYAKQDAVARTVFGKDMAPWWEIERHISLLFANIDPILSLPQPLTPNIIPIGGLQTSNPKKLPDEFQKYLDNSKDGVILFSLGTNVRSDKLPEAQQRALLDAFSKIKLNVIWKFESDIKDLPKNVMVRKWLPQNDILGHPNVKLFIGHGGALSTQEAIFHGVPMIAIPFIVDQYINSKMLVQRKLGTSIDSTQISSEYVSAKLREILQNPVYADNMKKASKRFRDRPETPLERAIYWVEYVMRHGGADFLSTPARDMPWYVSSGADVVAFLVLLLLTVLFVFFKLVKFIGKCLVGAPKEKVKRN